MNHVMTELGLLAAIALSVHVTVESYSGYRKRTNTLKEDIKYGLMGVASLIIGAILIVTFLLY
jgi:hypothetical protein